MMEDMMWLWQMGIQMALAISTFVVIPLMNLRFHGLDWTINHPLLLTLVILMVMDWLISCSRTMIGIVLFSITMELQRCFPRIRPKVFHGANQMLRLPI